MLGDATGPTAEGEAPARPVVLCVEDNLADQKLIERLHERRDPSAPDTRVAGAARRVQTLARTGAVDEAATVVAELDRDVDAATDALRRWLS